MKWKHYKLYRGESEDWKALELEFLKLLHQPAILDRHDLVEIADFVAVNFE